MRIAVWYNLPSGGAKRALYDHAQGLAGRGHVLEFFAPNGPGRDYLPLGAFGKEHTYPPIGSPRPPRLFPSVRRGAADMRHRSRAVAEHCREAAAAVDAGGFDVLFANTCMLTASPPVGRHARTPAVLYLAEPNRGLYEADDRPAFASIPPPGRSVLAPWYVRTWVRDRLETPVRRRQARDECEAALAFRRVLVNSYFSRESVWRAYGVESEVCYLGVNPAVFAPAARPARDYLVGLGSFTVNKNIAFAVRAVGCLPPPRPPLIWVGNSVTPPDHVDNLTALARSLGVEFVPRLMVRQAELTALLGGALAMVYAPRLEPFGYAPLEAGTCGTPVVAVAEGGVRETVRDGVNGLLVAPRPEAMAAAVARLRADPDLVERLGRTGRQLVETEWSLDAATDRLERALAEVAAGPKTP